MGEKKRVLFFVNIIAPYNISVFNRIHDLTNGDILFFFDQAKESNRNWKVENDKIRFSYKTEHSYHIVRKSKAINNTKLFRTIYFPFFVFRRIWSYKPNIVLSIEFGLRTFFSLIACKTIGAKIIIVSDVTTVTEANVADIKTSIRRCIARFADGAVARSYGAQKYLDTLGFSSQEITVAPYAIDMIDDSSSKSASSDIVQLINDLKSKTRGKFCFLFSGHFIHSKGVDILMRVVENLPQEVKNQMVFILAGGTERDLSGINPSYARNLFLPLGFIPNNEIIFLYQFADCFVLPTRSDTWALVVNEAVVAGCPVMLSKYAGSAGELIEDEISGVVFDPLKEDQFREKLIYCIINKEKLKVFANKAKEKLREYNNEVAGERFIEAIEKCSGKSA